MQKYSDSGVRLERTGWRDQEISEKHRLWGYNCPAVDLDWLVVEYHFGKPVAVVEYKHFRARTPDLNHATYRALAALANNSVPALPFFVATYWPDTWAMRVRPVNELAKAHFAAPTEDLSEYGYVKRLYEIRNLSIEREIEEGRLRSRLNTVLPPGSNVVQPMQASWVTVTVGNDDIPF